MLTFIIFAASLFGSITEERLQNIPQIEKEKMNCFFDYALKLGNAGHILYFQNKPMCLIAIAKSDECDSKFREGWEVFKKYEKNFPHPNFIINEKIKSFSSGDVIHIYLINKNAFLSCFKQHGKIFEEILGRKVDGTNFLKELESGNQIIDLIRENEILLGVLLGFGEESSKLYHQKLSESDESVESDKSYITFTSEMTDGIEIYPVAFKGSRYSQEAKKIIDQFHDEWKSLWQIYLKINQDSTKFFLEAFLGEAISGS